MPDIFASASGPKVGVVLRVAPARRLYIAAALGAVSLFATSSQAQELRVGAGYAPHAPEKDIIQTRDVDYRTGIPFNIGAIAVLAILAALYALFW